MCGSRQLKRGHEGKPPVDEVIADGDEVLDTEYRGEIAERAGGGADAQIPVRTYVAGCHVHLMSTDARSIRRTGRLCDVEECLGLEVQRQR
jgi:hypothetical protein